MPIYKKTRYLDAALIACSAAFIAFAFGTAVYFSNNLPLYIDEVTWNFFSGRSVIDHYNMTFGWPQCGRGFSQPLPWIWILPAWIDHLVYIPAEHVFYLRIINLACVFSWLCIWLLIFRRVFELGYLQLIVSCAAILGFFALDHVFLILLIARPEQAEILQLSIVVALAVYAPCCTRRPLLAAAGTALFILTTLQLGYTNPREIIFVPVFAFAGFCFFRTILRPPLYGFLFAGVISAILIYSYKIWLGRIACPEMNFRELIWRRDVFPFNLLWQNPSIFFLLALDNFTESLRNNLSSFSLPYWLGTPGAYERNAGHFFFTVTLLRMVLYFFALFFACRQIYVHFNIRNSDTARPEFSFMALCLLASLSGLLAFQGVIHPFTICVMNTSLLLLACAMVFASFRRKTERQSYAHAPVFVLLAFASVNLGEMISLYPHPEQYESIVEGRVISFSMKRFNENASALPALAGICKLDEYTGNHLVLDSQTYFSFRHGFEPYELYFATDQEQDYDKDVMHFTVEHFDLKAFMQFLARNRSSGIIGDCRNFPNAMRARAEKRNGFCCISEETIRMLAQP